MKRIQAHLSICAATLLWPMTAGADSRFTALPVSQREQLLRESLFAAGNPERSIGAEVNPVLQDNPEPAAAPEAQLVDRNSHRQIQGNKAGTKQVAGNSTVGLNDDGSVRVRSGNTGVDQSAEAIINRKIKHFIRSIGF